MEETKELLGKKIKTVPKDEVNIGIDTTNELAQNIVNAAQNHVLNYGDLDNFLSVAQNRESIYQLIDIMSQDALISSILEIYAENATAPSDSGDVMWVESEDENTRKYVSFLLKSFNINKKAFGHIYDLIKYGDLYLKLFKQSELKDDIFDNESSDTRQKLTEAQNGKSLNEDIIVKMQDAVDKFSTYFEEVKNPGEMFELSRYGKISGYVKAPYNVYSPFTGQDAVEQNAFEYYTYRVTKSDVEIYSATNFVHGLLVDNSGRTNEEVSIYDDKDSFDKNVNAHTYSVSRGKSILYDWFKAWREMSLLENSIILNRLTKSSIVRIIQVEVGDMPKEMIASHLQGIKGMMEQKTALESGNNIQNYTNPGPVENNIYVPTHNGLGTLSVGSVGGDVDPKQLTDLEYFRDKFFGGTGVPKQYLGQTADSTGFNGGTSLSLISSQFGKRVQRIQQAYISMITDLVNIILVDRGLMSSVGNFKLRMQVPVTQEEVDKRESQTNALGMLRDTMDVLSDIQDIPTRLKIIKSLMKNITADQDVIRYIQEEITRLENEQSTQGSETSESEEPIHSTPSRSERPNREQAMNNIESRIFGEEEQTTETPTSNESPEEESEENYLPSFAELGVNSNDVEI